jgi:Macrocin-O-methyltransferase (TylF)
MFAMISFSKFKSELDRAPFVVKQFASLLDRPHLIAFGAGNAFHGLRATIDLPFCYVLDDTPAYAGQSVDGLPIKSTAALSQMIRDKLCVVICANTTDAIAHMSQKLRSLGLVYGEHFVDCSLLHEITISGHLRARFNIFTSDERFSLIHALSRSLAVPNLSTISGTWLFTELIESLPSLADGYVAECGVYQGANALVSLLSSARLRSRTYQLFDSFEGLRDLSGSDPKSREGEFADTNFEMLRETLAIFPKVQLTKGYFESTLPKLDRQNYAVVYVDCDLERPTRFCCEFFWEKIQLGGYLLVHDYWFPDDKGGLQSKANFLGVKRAVDDFFNGRRHEAVTFPETSHAVFRKP